jgi:hypothetical protein
MTPSASPTVRQADQVAQVSYVIGINDGNIIGISASDYIPDLIESMDMLAKDVADELQLNPNNQEGRRRRLLVTVVEPSSLDGRFEVGRLRSIVCLLTEFLSSCCHATPCPAWIADTFLFVVAIL